MSTEVSFQPIYGSSNDGPVSSLLVIDGFKILLDCGWIEPFSISLIEPLRLYDFALLPLFHLLFAIFHHLKGSNSLKIAT